MCSCPDTDIAPEIPGVLLTLLAQGDLHMKGAWMLIRNFKLHPCPFHMRVPPTTPGFLAGGTGFRRQAKLLEQEKSSSKLSNQVGKIIFTAG